MEELIVTEGKTDRTLGPLNVVVSWTDGHTSTVSGVYESTDDRILTTWTTPIITYGRLIFRTTRHQLRDCVTSNNCPNLQPENLIFRGHFDLHVYLCIVLGVETVSISIKK